VAQRAGRFFAGLVIHHQWPVVAIGLEGDGVIASARKLIGRTNRWRRARHESAAIWPVNIGRNVESHGPMPLETLILRSALVRASELERLRRPPIRIWGAGKPLSAFAS